MLDIHKSKIQASLKTKFEEGTLTVLKVHEKDPALIWLEKNEIQYKRRRYDVFEIAESKGVLTIHCYLDEREEDLLDPLTDYEKNHTNNNSKNKVKLKFQKTLYFTQENKSEILTSSLTTIKNLNFIANDFSSICIDVIVPPPQA